LLRYNKDVGKGVSNISSISNNPKLSAKERFYANVDYKRGNPELTENRNKGSEQLRYEVRFKSEQIARDLLGEPNKRLSNGKTLRWVASLSTESLPFVLAVSAKAYGLILALIRAVICLLSERRRL